MKIKKGDIVGRNSYGKDILFIVERIIRTNANNEICILKGLTERIIHPAELFNYLDKWYIAAFCELRQEIRLSVL